MVPRIFIFFGCCEERFQTPSVGPGQSCDHHLGCMKLLSNGLNYEPPTGDCWILFMNSFFIRQQACLATHRFD